jgi:hypothetical protein
MSTVEMAFPLKSHASKRIVTTVSACIRPVAVRSNASPKASPAFMFHHPFSQKPTIELNAGMIGDVLHV